MMKKVSAYEAKTHLAQLLRQVAVGEEILITLRGKPVALLTPAPRAERDVQQVVNEMLAYRDKHKRTLGDITVRELIDEGRRY